jgi:hypothetical protein
VKFGSYGSCFIKHIKDTSFIALCYIPSQSVIFDLRRLEHHVFSGTFHRQIFWQQKNQFFVAETPTDAGKLISAVPTGLADTFCVYGKG